MFDSIGKVQGNARQAILLFSIKQPFGEQQGVFASQFNEARDVNVFLFFVGEYVHKCLECYKKIKIKILKNYLM